MRLIVSSVLGAIVSSILAAGAPPTPSKEQLESARKAFTKINGYIMSLPYFPYTQKTTVFDISRYVNAHGGKLNAEMVKNIPEVPFPHGLNIYFDKFTGDGLRHLQPRKNLVELNMIMAKLDEAGLNELTTLDSLESVDIWYCRELNNERLKLFLRMKKLKSLNIGGSLVTNEGLKTLAQMTQLEHLGISHLNLNDEGLQAIKGLVNLRTLRLMENRDITPAGLKALRDFKHLEDLNLSHLRSTDETLREVARHTKLKALNVFEGSNITDKGIEAIAGLTDMERLNLTYAGMTNEGLKKLLKMEKLTELSIGLTNVTEDAWQDLVKFKNLKKLDVSARWSNETVARIRKALPNCRVRE